MKGKASHWLNEHWALCTKPMTFASSATLLSTQLSQVLIDFIICLFIYTKKHRQSTPNASVSATGNVIMSKNIFSSRGDCSLVRQTDINQLLTRINAKLHHKRRYTAVWGCLVEDSNCTGTSGKTSPQQ